MLLGIDVGTTHCKAGLFLEDGTQITSSSGVSPISYDANGYPYYAPDDLWQVVRHTIQEVIADHDPSKIKAVGVASMAETGLLVDRHTGQPKTNFLPWYSKQAQSSVSMLEQVSGDRIERFTLTGIRPNYKCALTKLLWLKDTNSALLDNAIWLSTADYIVYRLTGVFSTDYSLAGRTYAFRIDTYAWDTTCLERLDLSVDIFAPAHPAGTAYPATDDCLAPGTPVTVAGHDHVCAAFAAGAISSDAMLDSMGTAETLLGVWDGTALSQREYDSGLLFGCHVIPDTHYWMGSLSASGGSVEWLRGIINDTPLTYEAIDDLLESVTEPTGILYFPYLSGSSTDSNALASFIGLKQTHSRAHLLKAVVEGTAYEIEHIRTTVETILGIAAKRIIVVGGATRSPVWIQIKADVSGCDYYIYPVSEAAVLGAAMVAGLGANVYQSAQHAVQQVNQNAMKVVQPSVQNHRTYHSLYEQGYLPLMQPLQAYYAQLSHEVKL
jgi:sugar (pentulose or hexulose) kinase